MPPSRPRSRRAPSRLQAVGIPEAPDVGVAVDDQRFEQSPAATAANLAFVTAHAAGLEAAVESGDQADYASGFAAERAWQLAWLVERLELPA